jgi:hypothetical protein
MHALLVVAALPFAQAWSDTGLIARDDDWSGVAGVVGYRGDGLTAAAGADPRSVVADGSGTPVDVNADRTDPRAVGLAAGVTEFELPDPVVALQGSATASAPHLVLSLDTRERSGVTVRYRLRDVDASSTADAAQAVALQYRVGASGDFAALPGGFVADATTGPGEAKLVTPVSAVLPAAAEDRPLVQLRIVTTNAVGQDEWVGVDDIEVVAGGHVCTPPSGGPPSGPAGPGAPPSPAPGGPPDGSTGPPPPEPDPSPASPRMALTGLALAPPVFAAARKGPAVSRSGRAGASLTFRLSRPATVRFRVLRAEPPRPRSPRAPDFDRAGERARALAAGRERARAPAVGQELGRFSVRGRRGLNRLRFTGRLRARPLPAGSYRLLAQASARDGEDSAPAAIAFRIR